MQRPPGAAFRTGTHVAIEMIVDMMPAKVQKIMEWFISIVVVAVVGYLFFQSIGFIQCIHKERPFHQHVKDSLYSRIRDRDLSLTLI